MKNIKVIMVVMLMLMFISSCKKNESELVSSDLSYNVVSLESNEIVFAEDDISGILKFSGDYDDLNAKYPITSVIADERLRRVVYASQKKVAVIYFDSNKKLLFSRLYSMSNVTVSQIEQPTVQALKDIMSIDPNGNYDFLYTGRNDTPKISTHFTTDGYMVEIAYDESDAIISLIKNKL